MQFSRDGEFLQVSRVTGPHHNLLGLVLSGDPVQEPKLEVLPALGSCSHAPLQEADVVAAVLEGIAAANAKLDGTYGAERIRVVLEDTPPAAVYALLASAIVEHLHAGGTFERAVPQTR